MAASLRAGVAMGMNDGRQQLCAVGAGGAMYHLSQTVASNGWSGWSSSGAPPGGVLISSPGVGPVNLIDKSGLGVYAAAGDTNLYSQQQVAADDAWGPWSSLGSPFSTPPSKVVSGGGINYLFASGADGTLKVQFDGPPGWTPHPGAALTGTPAVAPSVDGRLEVFATDANGVLFHQWQNVAAAQQEWSGWFSHGSPPGGTALAGSPALAINAHGLLALFIVGWDGVLYHIRQVAKNNGWSNWISHGTPPRTTLIASPSIALGPGGWLEVFVAGYDGALYHIREATANDDWSGWISHGSPPGTTVALGGSPCVAPSADGRLELFVVGADGALYHIWQPAHTDDWSAWYSHGMP
jgi:hypothetical protein